MNARTGLRIGTAMLLIAAPLPVWAQAAGTATDATDESTAADDQGDSTEIFVTAERRTQRLIDVPQSITALTADDLARLNATQLRDYANTVPALTVNSNGGAGQSQLTIRGVTSGSDVAPTTGIYVDDVPYGSSTVFGLGVSLALDAGLFDLDRIEILRGPQGTLYGASSMGGLLKYVTRRPDVNELEGTAQAGLSFTHDGGPNYNGAAAVSVPIVDDRLAVRAGGYYSRDGGYIDDVQRGENNVGNADIYGGRLDLLFTPTDALSIRLTAFAQNIDRDGTALADYTLDGEPVDGSLDQRRLIPEPFRQRFRLVSGTIIYDFGGAVLTSITSYQNIDTFFELDGSSVYVPLLNLFGLPVGATAVTGGADTDKFTQEVRLASSGEGMLEWIVGGFYTNEDSVSSANLVPYFANGDPFPLDLLTSNLPSTYEEIAGFGNLTVHLSDRFDVTGGLRYARNEQTYTQNATGILPVPNVPTQNSSEDVVTWLANARYRFSDHAAAYVRFATGYRPGGPNVVTFDPVTGAPLGEPTFESDTLASYEIGFKGDTVDRSFAIDVAVYHLDWDNILISSVTNGFNSYKNAEGAKVDGAELTLTARPSRNLTITGAFAYQDARLAADAPLLGGSKGDPLPNVPRYTAAINADYRFDAPGFQPTAGATLRFVSDRLAGFDGNPASPQYALGDYATLDLRAGASFGRFDAQVFVRNLFDDRGQTFASTQFAVGGFAPARVAIVQPRTIGIGVSTRF